MSDLSAVFPQMVAFVQEAARIALDLRSAGLSITHKGRDLGQALTEADLAISRLMNARFAPRLIEEETVEAFPLADVKALLDGGGLTYIGDPIDGTASYAGGLAGWGTMIAACQGAWPIASAMILPGSIAEPDLSEMGFQTSEQRGMLLAAAAGKAYWGLTRYGQIVGSLRPMAARTRETRHIGWNGDMSRSFTLDYSQGLIPVCEGGTIADTAALAMGRLDALTFRAKLWDLAPILPVLEALGFGAYIWPSAEPVAPSILDLFREDYSCRSPLIICRSRRQAEAICKVIKPAAS